MNKGTDYPGYKTDESVNGSSTEDEGKVTEIEVTEDEVAEESGTERNASGSDAPKPKQKSER